MEEVDLDVPKNDESNIDELHIQKKRELKLANNLNAVENKLRKVYFFTEEQIYDLFNKKTDQDGYFFEQIIRDVEQQYAKTPMDISINEYLYENLMSIETLNMEKRKQHILDNVHTILDGQNTKLLSYMDFIPHNTFSQEDARKNMKEYVKNHVQDFFVIHIDEDVNIEKDDKEKITSKLVQHYLSRTRMMGMNLYIFQQKNGITSIVVGVQKGTTGTTNDMYFGDLANKYNATKVTIPLSALVKTSHTE